MRKRLLPALFIAAAVFAWRAEARAHTVGEDFQTVADATYVSGDGDFATAFLLAAGNDAAPGKAAATQPSRLTGYLQFGFQGDTNVNAESTGTSVSGGAFSESLSVGYALVKTSALSVNAKSSVNSTQHPDSEANNYDMNQGSLGLDLSYVTAWGGVPVMPGVSYDWSRTWMQSDRYSDTHSLQASLGIGLGSRAMATASYGFSTTDLADDGTLPAETSRDGVSQSAGVNTKIFFADRKAALILGYTYGWSDTDGSNSDTNSQSETVGLWGRLPWDVDGRISYGMTHTEFTSYTGPLAHDSDSRSLSLSLSRNIAKKLKASFAVSSVADGSSNSPGTSYDRNIYSLTLGTQF